jgi:hypothetical protein
VFALIIDAGSRTFEGLKPEQHLYEAIFLSLFYPGGAGRLFPQRANTHQPALADAIG